MHYIDSESQDAAAELRKLGGAKVILSTITSGKAMSGLVGGLAANGKLVVLGAAPDTIEVSPLLLISGRRSIAGWPSGTAVDSQDTLAFCVLAGVRSVNEVFPLERAAEAYDRMITGKARFRVVLAPHWT
jgi:D-arabinose 1-dehydrogenase-like Zn-dependent alcohol dehydrogenase